MNTFRLYSYDCGFIIFTLFLALQYHYMLYCPTRIGPQLHDLEYLRRAAMRQKTADYEAEGSKPVTSRGIEYAPWDAR